MSVLSDWLLEGIDEEKLLKEITPGLSLLADTDAYGDAYGNTYNAYPAYSKTIYSNTPTTVTCTKQVRLYNYNKTELIKRYTAETEELTPGAGFTPSLHQPDIPDGYELDQIIMNGEDVTSGMVTCPSSNFTLIFVYTQDLVTVTCTKKENLWNYDGTELIASGITYEEFVAGEGFTPSAHQPSVSVGYSLYSITYNGRDVTTGTMTCPSSNFTLIFNYRKDITSHLWINNGSKWIQVIPYINNGSKWVEYKASLNNGNKWI